jgi:hypothetical protein
MRKEAANIRFDRFVSMEPNTGCWLWTGGEATPKGYGQFWIDGHSTTAHRSSWIIHCGVIPIGHDVLHHCDTPACVNPDHLFLGSHKDNYNDSHSKDRHSRGMRHGMSKLSDAQVRHIKSVDTSKRGVKALLARQFGVSNTIIAYIVLHNGWKHIMVEG